MRFLLLLILAYIGLTTYCVSDALQHESERPYGLPKVAWMFMIILVPILGGVTWLFFKYRGYGGDAEPEPKGPVRAPDNDPEYLSWLREQQRRRKGKDSE